MNPISLDEQLFQIINGVAGQNLILDTFVRITVNEFFVPTLLSLLLLGLWFYWQDTKDRDSKQKLVLSAFFAVLLGSVLVVSTINFLFERPRPFDTFEVNLLFYKPTDPSFPGNSAVVAFAIAYSIYLADKKIGLVALVLAAIYGVTRIIAGVHFPLDIVTGAVIGVGAVEVVKKFDGYLLRVLIFARNIAGKLGLGEFT